MRAKQALVVGSRAARLRTGTPAIAGLATGTCSSTIGYTANTAFAGSAQMCAAIWFRLTSIRLQGSYCNIVGSGTSTTGWSIAAHTTSTSQVTIGFRTATSIGVQYATTVLTTADIGNVHVVGFQLTSTALSAYQKKRKYSNITRSGTYSPSTTTSIVLGKGVAWDGSYTSSSFYGITVFGVAIALVSAFPTWSDYFDSIFQTNQMQPIPNASSAANGSYWNIVGTVTPPVSLSSSIVDGTANARTFTLSGAAQGAQFDALKRAKSYYGLILTYYAYLPGSDSVVNAVYRSTGGVCAGGAGASGFWIAVRYWASPNSNPNNPTFDVLTTNRTVETPGTANGWGCYRLAASGNFAFYVGSASRSIPAPHEGMTVGVGVFNGSTITAYVNGYSGLAAIATTLTSPGTGQQFGSTRTYGSDNVIFEVAGGHYAIDAATVLNQWADTQAKGVLAPIPGATEFYWNFGDGIRANDGQYLPTVVRDHYSGHHATLTYPDMSFATTPKGYALLTGPSYDPDFSSVSGLYGSTAGFWAGACINVVALPTSSTPNIQVFATTTKGSNLTATGGWRIYLNYTSGVSVGIYAEAYTSTGNTLVTLGPYIITSTGGWYVVVLNYDGSTYTLNVNGTAVATAAGAYAPAPFYCVPAQLLDQYAYTVQLASAGGGHVGLTAAEIAAQSATSLANYDLASVTDKTRDLWSITASMSSEASPSFEGVISNVVGTNPMCAARPCQTAVVPEGNWSYNEPTTRLVGLTGYTGSSTGGSYVTNTAKNSHIANIRGFWIALLVGVNSEGIASGYYASQSSPVPWSIYRQIGGAYVFRLAGVNLTTTAATEIGGLRVACIVLNYKGAGVTANFEGWVNGTMSASAANITSISSWSNVYFNSYAGSSAPNLYHVFYGAACGAVPLTRSDIWYMQKGIQVTNDIVAVPGKTTSLWSVKQSLTDTTMPPSVLKDQIGEDHATAVSLSGISLFTTDVQDYAW